MGAKQSDKSDVNGLAGGEGVSRPWSATSLREAEDQGPSVLRDPAPHSHFSLSYIADGTS